MVRKRQGHLHVPVTTGKTGLVLPHLYRSGGFASVSHVLEHQFRPTDTCLAWPQTLEKLRDLSSTGGRDTKCICCARNRRDLVVPDQGQRRADPWG